MRNFFLTLAMAVCILLSCSEKKTMSGKILTQPRMEAVLWDMLCTDEFIGNFVLKQDSSLDKRKESLKIYSKVFQIHEITEDEFIKSLTYYRARPDLLMAILDSINTKHAAPGSRPQRLKSGDSLKSGKQVIE